MSRFTLKPEQSHITVQQFRSILNIDPQNDLRCTEYALPGMDRWEWTHEELNRQGQLIARHVTSFSVDDSGACGRSCAYGVDGKEQRCRVIVDFPLPG